MNRTTVGQARISGRHAVPRDVGSRHSSGRCNTVWASYWLRPMLPRAALIGREKLFNFSLPGGDAPGELEGYGPTHPDLARKLAGHAPSFARILTPPLPGHDSGPTPPPIRCRRTCKTVLECGIGRVGIRVATGWQCFANSTIRNRGPTVERPATATSLPCANVTTGSNPRATRTIDNPNRGASSPSHPQAKPTSPDRTHHQPHRPTYLHLSNSAALGEKCPPRRWLWRLRMPPTRHNPPQSTIRRRYWSGEHEVPDRPTTQQRRRPSSRIVTAPAVF
ncbi:hypothetical protein IWX62_001282 [Arthrobacter sp. CAN_A1]